MTAGYFAYKQKLDYLVYKDLAAREKNPEFKATLEKLIAQELEDFDFWRKFLKEDPVIPRWKIYFFRVLRSVLGLTFSARFLEGREKGMIKKYTAFMEAEKDPLVKEGVRKIIEHERYHEGQFIGQIKEEKVEFLSSIILGLNDGLIEITGALVGFTLALQNHMLVALTGLIVGISASLSMSASAYLQAKHEDGKEPKKAALYTGISYIFVVLLLVAPYFLFTSAFISIPVMLLTVLGIIALVSFYSATLYGKSFIREFSEMAMFSLGVAVITFGIGILFRNISGVAV